MIRILVIGDAITPTGYARVIHSVLERLHHAFEFHHLGVNYYGDPHSCPWKIYPAGLHGDRHGINRLAPLIGQIKPHLIFMVGDLWILMQYAGILAKLDHKPPVLAYFPVESGPVESDAMVHLMRAVEVPVVYTRFAADEVTAAIGIARQSHPELPARPLHIIPHGVDHAHFHPLQAGDASQRQQGRRAARAALFPGQPQLADAFIILNANRNQPRKRIDVTMDAFARFAQGKPDNVKLYLHMARQDLGWDIQRLARRLGIEQRLLVSSNDNQSPSLSIEHLNLIYNACDVGINTSSAEGWGLVSFEHAATGAAQIVPSHTSLTELWQGAAELVAPSFSVITENILTTAHLLSPEHVAQAMERLYSDPVHRQFLSDAALRHVSHPRLQWHAIADQWHALFTSTAALN